MKANAVNVHKMSNSVVSGDDTVDSYWWKLH